MKVFLITSNATIEKLLALSAQKRGDDVVTGSFEDLSNEDIKAIFIDKDEFNEEKFNNLKAKCSDNIKFILILSKKDEKIYGFDEYLYKPFLPMEVINILETLSSDKLNHKDEENNNIDIENFNNNTNIEKEKFENLEEKDDFDLESFDLDKKIDKDDDKKSLLKEESEESVFNDKENLEFNENNNIKDNINKEVDNKNEKLEKNDDTKNLGKEDKKLLEETKTTKEDDFKIDEDKIFENDLEEGFEIDEDELKIEIEDNIVENIEMKDTTSNINEEKDIDKNNSTSDEKSIENKKENTDSKIEDDKKESNEELNIDDELKQIDEALLAKALGEEIEIKEDKAVENNENQKEKIEKEDKNIISEEKTLSSILNINWEELKKAKAKITINIVFGE